MAITNIGPVAVVGTGMIAVSMAVLSTGNGHPTTVLARSDKSVERARKDFMQYYQDLIAAGLITEKQRDRCVQFLTLTQDYQDIADVDFVIESVYEQLDVKQTVYRQIEAVCRPDVVIASMTSGIAPDLLAEGIATNARILVAHPFMPPHLVPCVEVVGSEFTSPEAIRTAVDLFESMGRAVIVLKKSIDGFIANRLQYALLRESIYLIEQGIATADDIDRTLLTSFGPRYSSIGIFEHMDNAGLDLVSGIQKYLNKTLCNDADTQKSMVELVNEGNLGSKSGKGYLDWSKKDLNDLRLRRSRPYFKFFNWQIPE